jgi:hypothetical protein
VGVKAMCTRFPLKVPGSLIDTRRRLSSINGKVTYLRNAWDARQIICLNESAVGQRGGSS